MSNNTEYIQEDEIDLRELFKTIWDKKVFIAVFTTLITLVSIVFVFFKNPTPIYKGSLLVEIGYIQSENFGEQLIENPNNLSKIISTNFNVQSSSPKKTNSLIEISSQSTNKEKIKDNINKAYAYVLEKHLDKSKFYSNTIMTKKIGDVKISNNPINQPKKKLIVIVSFVTAFILSIFLVFFMQFVKSIKNQI